MDGRVSPPNWVVPTYFELFRWDCTYVPSIKRDTHKQLQTETNAYRLPSSSIPNYITYITVLNCILSKFIPIDTYSTPHESKFPAFSIVWFFKKFILCEIHTCGTVLMCQITQKSTLTPTQAKKCIRGNRVFGNRVMQRLGLDMLKLFKLDTR